MTRLPLEELWTNAGLLDSQPAESAGAAKIEHLLQNGASFVVADVGKPLRWISTGDRFSFWKSEVKARLVAPEAARFAIDEYPNGYCYVATVWNGASPDPVIVLEMHH
ncbi:hypothetical protein [Bradyrhizobium sp. BR 1432]|uniref:hypothetical protein n=1 Tax=Bradyrhizobium sp. BR 1432 TaxID=3447966 RepID=UPI003EE625BC